jgi:hypothetical protein
MIGARSEEFYKERKRAVREEKYKTYLLLPSYSRRSLCRFIITCAGIIGARSEEFHKERKRAEREEE